MGTIRNYMESETRFLDDDSEQKQVDEKQERSGVDPLATPEVWHLNNKKRYSRAT